MTEQTVSQTCRCGQTLTISSSELDDWTITAICRCGALLVWRRSQLEVELDDSSEEQPS